MSHLIGQSLVVVKECLIRLPTTALLLWGNLSPVLGNTDTSVTLVNEFLNWSRENCMSCNPSKCKELVIKKKSNKDTYNPVNCISQHNDLCLLGVTLQSDCKFSSHVKVKLIKANKCLHILRTLRKEQYDQN